jgi:hypothetical protein
VIACGARCVIARLAVRALQLSQGVPVIPCGARCEIARLDVDGAAGDTLRLSTNADEQRIVVNMWF